MVLKRVCAWCQADLGEIDCPVSGVTHGICPECLMRMRARLVLRREHIEAGLTLEEDDHVIQLKSNGQAVAYFTTQAKKESILEKADEYLKTFQM